MRMRNRLYFLALVTVGLLAHLAGCDGNEKPSDKTEIGLVNKFPELTMTTHEELFEQTLQKTTGPKSHGLNDIALYFASNKKWLKKTILTEAKDRGIAVTELADDAKSSELVLDGISYTIKVSLLNEKQSEILSRSEKEISYAVGLDPDVFYAKETEMPVYYWNKENKEIEERFVPIIHPSIEVSKVDEIKAVKDAIEFPVFLVSIEENEPMENIGKAREMRGSLNKNAATMVFERHPYLSLYSIKLKDKEDYAEEEFELFYSGVNTPYIIGMYTDMLFNGNYRNDIAGRYVKYPDVNGINTYNCPNWIAIANMDNFTSTSFRMVAIENDDNAGKIKVQGGSVYLGYNTQHFKVGETATTTDEWEYDTDGNGGWPFNDDDDVYKQSGVSKVTKNNLITELRGRSDFNTDDAAVNLEDVNYKLGIEIYPPYLACGITPTPPAATVGNTYAFYANASGASGSYTYLWEYYRCTGEQIAFSNDPQLPPGGGCGWNTKSTASYTSFMPMNGDILKVTVTDTQSGEVATSSISW
ncbi:hypothetical protein JNM05_00665 [bacterium]|nr:hypothetical protein [bacterium]